MIRACYARLVSAPCPSYVWHLTDVGLKASAISCLYQRRDEIGPQPEETSEHLASTTPSWLAG